MKKIDEYTIMSNLEINCNHVYEVILEGNISLMKPGQFVEVKIPNHFLRRPFSIAYQDNDKMHLVYRVVGEGTEELANMKRGEKLDILSDLGNGFNSAKSNKPLLVGGGTGVAPIYFLACSFIDKGIDPTILLGFKNKEDSIYLDKFLEMNNVYTSYESNKDYRYVTDYMDDFYYDYFYGCGPYPMLKAVSDKARTDGEVSLEARMGCGFGQCKGCSIETTEGMKSICKDGPVFQKKLVRW